MRLSRTDKVPVFTIVAGGVIGAALSFGFLGLLASGDVPVTVTLRYESSATLESATRRAARVGTVTGQIVDAQTGGSVAAVQVYIASLELGGLSQQNGRYLLQNVPPGTHTLSVARIGYRNTEAQITVGGGQTVEQNFSVAAEALQLDEIAIVVAGTPCGTQQRVTRSSSRSPVNIRGFSSIEIGNQPLIYIDGRRVYNSGACDSLLDDVNPDDIESIEIVKGPAAVGLYGEEASAGAIVITLKEASRRR